MCSPTESLKYHPIIEPIQNPDHKHFYGPQIVLRKMQRFKKTFVLTRRNCLNTQIRSLSAQCVKTIPTSHRIIGNKNKNKKIVLRFFSYILVVCVWRFFSFLFYCFPIYLPFLFKRNTLFFLQLNVTSPRRASWSVLRRIFLPLLCSCCWLSVMV